MRVVPYIVDSLQITTNLVANGFLVGTNNSLEEATLEHPHAWRKSQALLNENNVLLHIRWMLQNGSNNIPLLRCQICCMDNKFSDRTNHHFRLLRFWKVLGAWQMKINDVQFGIIPQHNYKWWWERNCIQVGDWEEIAFRSTSDILWLWRSKEKISNICTKQQMLSSSMQ